MSTSRKPYCVVDIQGTSTSRTCDVMMFGDSESSEFSAAYMFEDNPNWHSFHDMPVVWDATDEENK